MAINGTEYERALVRSALLDAQSEWLEESERDGIYPTERTIALVIADAFGNEAEKYKTVKETNDHDAPLWSTDDELGATPAFPA